MKKLLVFISILTFSCSQGTLINIEMVPIIGKGEKVEFIMGATAEELKNQPHRENDPDYYFNDEQAHKVILTIPYAISKYEITNSQYVDIMNYGINKGIVKIQDKDLYDNYERKLLGIKHLVEDKYLGIQHGITVNNNELTIIEGQEECPVHAVTWVGALIFCNLLSETENLDPAYNLEDLSWDENKNGYRLPTEAEWEYAARGNKRYTYSWGNEYGAEYCCTSDFNDSTNWKILYTPVGFFDGSLRDGFQTQNNSSPFGIYDMTGNIWEWCWDWYSKTYFQNSPEINPKGPDKGELRPPYDVSEPTKVWRGCGYMGTSEYSRITKRWSVSTQVAINEVGFRIAKTIK